MIKYLSFIYRFLSWRLVLFLIIAFGSSALDAVGVSLFLPILTEDNKVAVFGGYDVSILSKNELLIIIALVLLVKSIFTYFTHLMTTRYQHYFTHEWRRKMVGVIEELSFDDYKEYGRPLMHTLLSSEIVRVSDAVFRLLNVILYGVMIAVYVLAAALTNGLFSAIVLIISPLMYFIYATLKNKLVSVSRDLKFTNLGLEKMLSYYLDNILFFRGNRKQHLLREKFFKSSAEYRDAYFRFAVLNSLGISVREPLILIILFSSVGAYNLISHSWYGLPSIVAVLFMFYRASSYYSSLQVSLNQFRGLTDSIDSLLAFEKDASQRKTGMIVMDSDEPSIHWKSISCRRDAFFVNYSSFELKRGDKVHFRGKSGSGKSSFLRMLVGLNKSTDIHIGKELTLAYLPQDLTPMKGTLLDNALIFEPNFSSVFFNEYAKKLGLDKRLDENIETLSGGELQKFYIILVIFGRADILILDEPVSAMDLESTQSVLEVLESLESGVFMAAHNVDQKKFTTYDI